MVRLGKVVVVTHDTVSLPMSAATSKLIDLGCDVDVVESATFNSATAEEPTVDVLLVSAAANCNRSALERYPKLRGVVYIASGTDPIDLAAAKEREIVVAHSPVPEAAESMAEATIMLILNSLYQLKKSENILRLQQPRPQTPLANMLKGRVVGMVGFGRIPKEIVKRLSGWGIQFLVYSPRSMYALPDGIEAAELDDLLERSDIVSIHAALNPETRNLIDRKRVEKLKQGAIFINTSRGGTVDEEALTDAAAAGRIGFLVLDVFAKEPLPGDSPLRELDNAILTPHIAGHTREALEAVISTAVDNTVRILRGEQPLYRRA